MLKRVGQSALFMWLVVSPSTGLGAQEVSRERQVKAAFLFNVLKFVEWPTSAQPGVNGVLRVAVLGREAQADIASALDGKTVRGWRLDVKSYDRVKDIEGCHVLLITPEAEADLGEALRTTQGRPVLTVSDTPQRTQTPAMITLTVIDTKLAFSVNLDAADASGLQLSSNLLGLAKSVQSQRLKTRS